MDRRALAPVVVLLAIALMHGAGAQSDSKAAPGSMPAAAPLYRVSFERHEAVLGADASYAIKLPFECTADGTVFVSFIDTVPAGVGVRPPPGLSLRLVSVTPAGHAQAFDLHQIPGLYVSREVDHYASESEVVFLVNAEHEYRPEKKTYPIADGKRGEFTSNAAEQRRYIVSFSRDGTYRRTVEIGDLFRIQQLGVFPSGVFLAFGYDESNNSPKLAMLKEDGTLLKTLQPLKGDVPESVFGSGDGKSPGVIRPAELVPEGRSILIVQSDGALPLLEVDEGGAVRAIRPRLPKDAQVKALIPSDRSLYVVARPKSDGPDSEGTIYEMRQDYGSVLRRFELSDRLAPSDVACVHDQKFLSLDYGDGKIVPLIGSAEPAPAESR